MSTKKVKMTSNPNMVNILAHIPQAFNLPSVYNLSNLLLYFSPSWDHTVLTVL